MSQYRRCYDDVRQHVVGNETKLYRTGKQNPKMTMIIIKKNKNFFSDYYLVYRITFIARLSHTIYVVFSEIMNLSSRVYRLLSIQTISREVIATGTRSVLGWIHFFFFLLYYIILISWHFVFFRVFVLYYRLYSFRIPCPSGETISRHNPKKFTYRFVVKGEHDTWARSEFGNRIKRVGAPCPDGIFNTRLDVCRQPKNYARVEQTK